MTPLEFVLLLVLAGLLGAFAQRMLGARYGLFVSILLGFAGAWLGKMLHVWFHLPIVFFVGIGEGEGAQRFPVLWAVVGALIVTFAAGLIAGSRRKPDKKK